MAMKYPLPTKPGKEKTMAKKVTCPKCGSDEIDVAGRCVWCQTDAVKPKKKK